MSLLVIIGIGIAGGMGAVARLAVDGAIAERAADVFPHRRAGEFPLGTLAVNLTGAFALGLVAGAALGGDGFRLVATGLLGAYTTFSTWAFESQRLAEDGELCPAALNFALSLALGLLLVWAGDRIGAAL